MTNIVLDKEFFHSSAICEFFYLLFPLILLVIFIIKFIKKMDQFAEQSEYDINLGDEKSDKKKQQKAPTLELPNEEQIKIENIELEEKGPNQTSASQQPGQSTTPTSLFQTEKSILNYFCFIGILCLLNINNYGCYIFCALCFLLWVVCVLIFNLVKICYILKFDEAQKWTEIIHLIIVWTLFINYFANDQETL